MSRDAAAPAPRGRRKATPALSSAPMSEGEVQRVVGSIGPKIKALRTEHALSLQQLADRSDVSPAAIHKIEQGTMVPTITTLLKLVTALNRPISYFVEHEPTGPDPLTVVRSDERPEVYTSREGIVLEGISGEYGRYDVAAAVAAIEPHATSGDGQLNHEGEELVHVLSGVLEVSVGGQVARLTAGDSAHFRTDVDHSWRNPTGRAAKAVWVALRPDRG